MVLQNDILDRAQGFLTDNSIITGGHFRLFFDSLESPAGLRDSINPGTLKSFELAVKLFIFATQKNIKAELGVLINDMGSSCEEEGCLLKASIFSRENFSLPQQYLDIMNSYGLNKYRINMFWEKHARNAGKKHFLKVLKNIYRQKDLGKLQRKSMERHVKEAAVQEKARKTGEKTTTKTDISIKKEANGFFLIDPGYYEKIILTRTAAKDKYGTPACPLIMAGLSIIQGRLYRSSINFYYTGADNISNIPNYFVIEKGKRVAELFGIKINVENIYFDSI
ncbi:MAG: hypothetical protein FJW66_04595 [Actinobacteria bacterium]|nr:hypothetical protein [Actinomycetota bacterium]